MKFLKENREFIDIILEMIIVFAIILIQWYQLEYSSIPLDLWWFSTRKITVLLEIALICLPNIILAMIFQKWFVSLTISSVLISVWSIANHYVIMFHGGPITITELKNMGTAMEVASGYKYPIDGTIINLVVLAGVEIACILVIAVCFHSRKWIDIKRSIGRLILLVGNILFIYICLYDSTPIKPRKVVFWSWNEAMRNYGYISCLVEDVESAMNPYIVPTGYDSKKIEKAEIENLEEETDTYPDIILILNETFYDFNVYMDMPTDKDYLKPFYGVENAVYGNAVIPHKGGGTNNSEFELLTSHSMRLLSSAAPFNFVNFEKVNDNFVQYLKSFDYNTFAFHCETPANYSRNRAYPEMGFDNVFLGNENFPTKEKYGNRNWTDSGNIKDMLDKYEKAGDGPRFMYLLTYQNHGGYVQNDSELDTVHTVIDLGEKTEEVNEFLSSVSLSAQAFADLTDYLSKSNRPVIVCMIGDHAPPLIYSFEGREGMSEDEKEIAACTVPYAVWSNYDLEFPEGMENVSMVDVVPMLLKAAKLPLTPYYQYILDMHETLPIRTSSGRYVDANGEIGTYEQGNPYYEMLSQYYYQEYNLLKKGDDYIKELFEVKY